MAIKLGVIQATVTTVVCDRACRTEEVAKKFNVPLKTISSSIGDSREIYTQKLMSEIPEDTDLVCISLKRLVGPELIQKYKGRLINTHPTLLPAYKGFGANKLMLSEGKTLFGGCSLHLVDEEMDNGSIIIQSALPLLPGLSQRDLEIRLWEMQRHNFTQVLSWYAQGRVNIIENKALILNAHYGTGLTNPELEINFDEVDNKYEFKNV